jgi:hypothetical protein
VCEIIEENKIIKIGLIINSKMDNFENLIDERDSDIMSQSSEGNDLLF